MGTGQGRRSAAPHHPQDGQETSSEPRPCLPSTCRTNVNLRPAARTARGTSTRSLMCPPAEEHPGRDKHTRASVCSRSCPTSARNRHSTRPRPPRAMSLTTDPRVITKRGTRHGQRRNASPTRRPSAAEKSRPDGVGEVVGAEAGDAEVHPHHERTNAQRCPLRRNRMDRLKGHPWHKASV